MYENIETPTLSFIILKNQTPVQRQEVAFKKLRLWWTAGHKQILDKIRGRPTKITLIVYWVLHIWNIGLYIHVNKFLV